MHLVISVDWLFSFTQILNISNHIAHKLIDDQLEWKIIPRISEQPDGNGFALMAVIFSMTFEISGDVQFGADNYSRYTGQNTN